MQPIISPWWFYLISVSDNIRKACLPVALVSVVAIFVIVYLFFYGDIISIDKIFKYIRIPFGLLIIVLLCGILIPSKEACYQMIATSVVTPNNIETVKDGAKDLVDYIIDATKEVSESKEEK